MKQTLLAMSAVALLSASAVQAADPYPQQQYPQQQYPQQQFQQQQGGQPHPMRDLFAASLSSVAQTTGSAAIVAVADGLTGALKNWFDNRRNRKGTNGALGNNYPPSTPMSTQSYPAPMPDASGYPNPGAAPTDGNSNGYPATDPYLPAGDAYPTPNAASNGGYPDPNGAYPVPAAPPSPVYAGIAYEIHLLQRDGTTVPVDTLSYAFRTGDQFRVFYRPSLPGRVDVYNINAAGENAQIDTSVVAAGELASLGPYEFTRLQGEETLILKLSPCVTPALYATTRNIVKVQSAPANYPAGNALGFGDCNAPATRGLKPKTRDIRKVSVEGGTSFALDQIAPEEMGSGDMAPRQVTITLHHR